MPWNFGVEEAEKVEALLGPSSPPYGGYTKEEVHVRKVTETLKGWEVTGVDDRVFLLKRKDISRHLLNHMPKPQPGDRVTVYLLSGSGVIGADLNHKRLFLKSQREINLEWLMFRAQLARMRSEEFYGIDKPELDRKYQELPAPLKARIDRFRAKDPDFRVQSEAYEMAAVYDAPKIARALAQINGWELTEDLAVEDVGITKDALVEMVREEIQKYLDASYEEQTRIVPDLGQGHSGNTFAGAVHLAYGLLAGKEV